MITNNQEKIFRSLKSSKGRREHGLILAEGTKVIAELLKSDFQIEAILSSSETEFDTYPQVERCSQKTIDRISALKTPSTEIAVVRIPEEDAELELKGPMFVLESIQDPGNLGTMIRTLRWFGANQVLVSEDCADAFNPKVVQASMGAVFHLNVIKRNLGTESESLKENGYRIIATEMNGNPGMSRLSGKVAIVIGNEGHGISDELKSICDESVSIPGAGADGVESLNAAISLGILAHQVYVDQGNG